MQSWMASVIALVGSFAWEEPPEFAEPGDAKD
jgi:hypothetical protein